ncbi:MAG: hypothetical protein ACYCQK_01815 [Acidiferrobacteraceae bacterium]
MTGFRHHPQCLCGCQFVVGLPGEVVQDADARELARFGLAYVRFEVPSHTGAEPTPRTVCYSLAEIRKAAA